MSTVKYLGKLHISHRAEDNYESKQCEGNDRSFRRVMMSLLKRKDLGRQFCLVVKVLRLLTSGNLS